MELQIYDITLLIVGLLNLTMAVGLLAKTRTYRQYPVYCRSLCLTAVFFAVFGIGMLLHFHFQWRMSYPLLATALSVSYFHISGVFINWSHTSLLNPRYLGRKVLLRDIPLLAVGIPAYWITATSCPLSTFHYTLLIFLVHCVFMAFDFYTTYFRVSRRLIAMQQGSVEGFMRWMLRSCHLIIAFGLGSIMFTSFFPVDAWPFTALLIVGAMVFVYIYFSLCEYGHVIHRTTIATSDANDVS